MNPPTSTRPLPAWWRLPEVFAPVREGGTRVSQLPCADSLEPPVLTVITVTLNAAAHLEKTLQSVLALPMANVEYIILDGGSADATLALLEAYSHSISYWVVAKDRGIYDAMNRGMHLARGAWVTFLNAGDTLTPEAADLAGFNPEHFALVHGFTLVTGAPFERFYQGRMVKGFSYLIDDHACHQSIFYNREDLLEYDLSYKIIADRVMTCQMMERTARSIGLIPKIVCTYDDDGFSSRNLNLKTWEYLRAAVAFGYPLGFLKALATYPKTWAYFRFRWTGWYGAYRRWRERVGF